jgi:iron complex outermembrane receptor protein
MARQRSSCRVAEVETNSFAAPETAEQRYDQGVQANCEKQGEHMTKKMAGLLLASACTMLPQVAWAQEAANETTGGDIIVTARRTEERLQDVPIAITAFGAEQLRERQLSTEADLQTAVPGLTIRQSGSANQFNYALRGQSVDTYTGSPPGVLPYINEAQVVTRAATTFYDLRSIQVLKGPQGTLFGRNATGGAVLFETEKPGDKLEGYALGRYSNYDSLHAEGAVSIPFAVGGLRIAGLYEYGGAFVKNLLRDENLGKQDIRSVRGTLRLEPFEGLENTTVVQHTAEGGNNVPTLVYSAYACGETFNGAPLNSTGDCVYGPTSAFFNAYIAAHPNLFPGGVAASVALQRQRGPWETDLNVPLSHQAQSTFAINTTTLKLSPSVTVKNIFMWNRSHADDAFDYDGTSYPIFQTGGVPTVDAAGIINPLGFIQKTRQISEELQVQGTTFDSRLNFVVGGFYLNQRDENDSNIFAFDFSPLAPGSPLRYHQLTQVQSKALFAQGTFAVTDQFHVTGGFRWTWEKTSARQLPGSIWLTAFPANVTEVLQDDKPSWTVSLDYQVTPDLLVYAAHRGSWRAGGYNYSVPPIDAPAGIGGNRFNPETTKDVEVGIKYSGDALGLPLTFNVAAYNQWVKNIQRAAYVNDPLNGTASLVTVNVPKAEITGVEAELTVRPTSSLTLGISGAHTNARYTENLVNLTNPQGGPAPTYYGPYADAPKWTGNAFVQSTYHLGTDNGTLTFRADVYGQTMFFFSNVAATSAPRTSIPGYVLVNGRVSWNNISGTGISGALFVRNLLNREYYGGGNSLGPTLGINTSVPGRPRMWGGELRVDF